jgi:hypothetical protein
MPAARGELGLDAAHQILIGNVELAGRRPAHRVGQPGELLVAEREQRLRLGGVVAVDVNDHWRMSIQTHWK